MFQDGIVRYGIDINIGDSLNYTLKKYTLMKGV